MGRELKSTYCFIRDINNLYYQAKQKPGGDYIITKSNQPYPLTWNPVNLLDFPLEFNTNDEYFSLVRVVSDPLRFVKDGAAILRNSYFLGNGIVEEMYLVVIEWNGRTNMYELSYSGKFDFSEKTEDPKSGSFTINTVDDTAWGVLSENDDVTYAIDCSPTNPKAIRTVIDSITLVNRYTFQTVNAPVSNLDGNNGKIFAFILANEDGDSSGIIAKNQSYEQTDNLPQLIADTKNYSLETFYALNGVNIQGDFSFSWSVNDAENQAPVGLLIRFYTNFGKIYTVFANGYVVPAYDLIVGKIYTVSFNFNWDLAVGERIIFGGELNANSLREFTITPIVTNIFITTKTKAEPVVVYGLRAIDLLQDLVSKATRGRYTIASDFFSTFNKDFLTSGESIRGIQNPYIYTSFKSFFKTFNSVYFLSLKNFNQMLHLEKATTVYGPPVPLIKKFTLDIDPAANKVIITPVPLSLVRRGFQITFFIGGVSYFGAVQTVVNNGGVSLSVIATIGFPLSLSGINENVTIIVQSTLQMEPAVPRTVYDIGDALDLKIVPAKQYYANEIAVGSPKQDYRHPSGRMEFNSTNLFSLPFPNIRRQLELVTDYRLGCYDVMFMILDYRGLSTKDNTGDKSVYVLKITDELVSTAEDVETFVSVTIDNVLLAPVIKSPLNNDIINYDLPFLKGTGIIGNTVFIYVFDVLDGSAVVDANGNWSYQIVNALSSYNPGVATGQHDINATYTNMAGVLNTISIVINTDAITLPSIVYPANNDNLYNNKPLIKGVAPNGSNVTISIDGVDLVTLVADNSGRWEYKIINALPNGRHIVAINAVDDTAVFDVNSFVTFPLITYVGGELDNFTVLNNMPLIQGVAIPGTLVEIWLDYIPYSPIGIALANASGNWSFQVVPITYPDPLSGIPATLAPIHNGLVVLSTSLINHTVPIDVKGFKLERPNFDSITGVVDNTVFNTAYTPHRMLENWYPMLSAILNQQRNAFITFEKGDKNSNLRTVINGKVIAENASINGTELGEPLALLEWAEITVDARNTFAKTLTAFNDGGLIKTRFRGTDLYMLAIGGMKIKGLKDSKQEWKLLLAPTTSYLDLLNLYKNGIKVNVMKHSVYHSDYNSLHMVEYNFQRKVIYDNAADLYDDWFNERNEKWSNNPPYIQKYQQTDRNVIDQIITNGASNLRLKWYKCEDATLFLDLPYLPVVPNPLTTPEVLFEVLNDFGRFPEGQYFGVVSADTAIESGLLIPTSEQGGTSLNWLFSLSGDSTTPGTIYVNLYIGKAVNTPVTFQYNFNAGDSIISILNSLKDAIARDSRFSVDSQTIGVNPGLSITCHVSNMIAYVEIVGSEVTTSQILITERIEVKTRWIGSIAIEADNSVNMTGFFFSTGAKMFLRVEGLVKKYQPDMIAESAREEDGDAISLYGGSARKRMIRFGTAYGLPDYLYLKIADAAVLDNFKVQGVAYTIADGEKIESADEVDGHPLYYYNVIVNPKIALHGITVGGAVNNGRSGVVILVTDASAFGLPTGTIKTIELDEE